MTEAFLSGGSTGHTSEIEARFGTLVESASDAIFSMDEDGLIISANPAAERMFGYPIDELIGRPLTMLMPEDQRAAHEQGRVRYLRTGERRIPWTGVELPGRHRDGTVIPLEISFGEYAWGGRTVFTGIVRDIGERVRAARERDELLTRERAARADAESAREDAESANRAKSQFLATVSHEIRTPMNAIIGYVDLLKLGIGGDLTAVQREHVDRIQSSSAHLLTLIEDILDLARVEAGRLRVEEDRALISSAVVEAMKLVEPFVVQHRIEISELCGEDPEACYFGDAIRVRQIVVNLLSNAVKFTEAGGRVRVSCGTAAEIGGEPEADKPPRWTWVRVEDTGIGIQAEVLGSVFQPFVQLDGGARRKRGGTGLGLTISRKLAWLMGGDLTAHSEPGVGSAFTLWLPRQRPSDVVSLAEDLVGRDDTLGLAQVGRVVIDRLPEIMQAFVERVRTEPMIPAARDLAPADLQDHIATFLTDVAQALSVVERSKIDRLGLMQDGTAIQNLISDLHGSQRRRLGWNERALHREFEILRGTVRDFLLTELSDAPGIDLDEDLRIVDRLLATAERVSLLGWRLADGDKPHPPPPADP